jgi:hypothetical protein
VQSVYGDSDAGQHQHGGTDQHGDADQHPGPERDPDLDSNEHRNAITHEYEDGNPIQHPDQNRGASNQHPHAHSGTAAGLRGAGAGLGRLYVLDGDRECSTVVVLWLHGAVRHVDAVFRLLHGVHR